MSAASPAVADPRRTGSDRRTAFHVLRDVEAGERTDESLDRRARDLDRRERAFAMELAFGSVRWRGRIDHHLDHLLDRGLASLPPDLIAVLELGAYQILFMDRVPDRSAVDESVRLAREVLAEPTAGWAVGLVNGVLRNLARRRDALPLPDPADGAGRLAVEHSHPKWLVERWLARLGPETTAALLARDNRTPRLHLALHPRAGGVESVLLSFRAAGIDAAPHAAHPDAIVVEGGVRPDRLPGWGEGRFWVQDAGAQWVSALVDPPADGPFLDACAAPGGKLAALLARSLAPSALALDLEPRRLLLVRQNLDRLGLDGAWLVAADARAIPARRPFPLVLVDAPCSGTGVLGRRPDARWRREPGDIGRFAAFQGELLDGVADRVAPDGVLLYATCSLEPEENTGVVEAFLARRPDFRVDPAGERIPVVHREGPYLATRPWETDVDGMFAARLVRRAS
ncbi:MAG: 16S rRNA (cytosine(967)-C(5))-methyltransferase RsmB [Gemmatimonadota bacterium]